MYDSFCAVARRINTELSVLPLLYGSVGLQRLLQSDSLRPDDIDILLPKNCLEEDWPNLLCLMRGEGYALIDEHKHVFRRGAVEISFEVNDLDGYAGIELSEALSVEDQGASYTLLNLKQYLALYKEFTRDRYRRRVKRKYRSDREKICMIRQALRNQKHPTG